MKRLCKNKYWNIQKEYNIDNILYLLIDRPLRINFAIDFIWENNKGQFHRKYDLPAIVEYNSRMDWFENDFYIKEI